MTDLQRQTLVARVGAWLCLGLLLCLLESGPAGAAQPVTVDMAQTISRLDLARDAVLFEDPGQSLKLRQVLQLPLNQWQAVDSNALPLGYSRSAWWVRLAFTNSGQQEERRIVEIGWPLLDWADIYVLDHGQVIEEIHTGDQ